MSDVKVPGIGNVPKPALIAVGAASAGILAYAWYRHNSSANTSSDTTTTDTVDSSIDPATGIPYADEYGYTNSGYQLGGVTDPSTGTIITGGNQGTGVVQITTNAQWAQAAQAYLASIGGYDATTVAAALGAGLLGHYITPDQVGIWNAAVAFYGNPPQGYPPLNTTPPQGQPPPVTTPPAPAGFKSTGKTSHSVTLTWSPVPNSLEYHVKIKGPGFDHTIITHNTTYTVGNLNKSSTYQFYVMAQNGAGTGAASPTISVKTNAK